MLRGTNDKLRATVRGLQLAMSDSPSAALSPRLRSASLIDDLQDAVLALEEEASRIAEAL